MPSLFQHGICICLFGLLYCSNRDSMYLSLPRLEPTFQVESLSNNHNMLALTKLSHFPLFLTVFAYFRPTTTMFVPPYHLIFDITLSTGLNISNALSYVMQCHYKLLLQNFSFKKIGVQEKNMYLNRKKIYIQKQTECLCVHVFLEAFYTKKSKVSL